MNLLFIGDIAWRPGREIVKEILPTLRRDLNLDLVVANCENAKHGSGMTLEIYEELRAAGIDWMTSGDHIWRERSFFPFLDDPKIQVLRPANYPSGVPGRGFVTIEVGGETLTLINLIGTVFVTSHVDNPFRTVDELLRQARGFSLIDFHAEATREKNTMGHYVDGRAGALLGTHTHVQTADERLLPKGTAYISDVGMAGALNGSIGVALESVLPMFLRGLPAKYEAAEGPVQLNAVLLAVENSRAISIERICKIVE